MYCIGTAGALHNIVHGFSLPLNPDLLYSQSAVLCLSSGKMASCATHHVPVFVILCCRYYSRNHSCTSSRYT